MSTVACLGKTGRRKGNWQFSQLNDTLILNFKTFGADLFLESAQPGILSMPLAADKYVLNYAEVSNISLYLNVREQNYFYSSNSYRNRVNKTKAMLKIG